MDNGYKSMWITKLQAYIEKLCLLETYKLWSSFFLAENHANCENRRKGGFPFSDFLFRAASIYAILDGGF